MEHPVPVDEVRLDLRPPRDVPELVEVQPVAEVHLEQLAQDRVDHDEVRERRDVERPWVIARIVLDDVEVERLEIVPAEPSLHVAVR